MHLSNKSREPLQVQDVTFDKNQCIIIYED